MMKKILPLLLLPFLLGASHVKGQVEINRSNVLIEVFTGTWCVFCPGAALASEDMISNGHEAVILKHHIGDNYENSSATARDNFYAVTGYPTQVFDGTDQFSGGNANSTMYSTYLNSFTNAFPVTTPIEMSLEANRVGRLVAVTAIATQVATVDPNHMPRLMIGLTESEIQDTWFIMDEVSFVNRGMYPDANGTLLNFNGVGTSDTVEILIEMDAEWDYNHAEVIAFVQDLSSKVVYNSDKKDIATSSAQYAISQTGFNAEINETFCGEMPINPEINVFNFGSEVMTTFDVKYSINGGQEETYTWNGNLDPESEVTVMLPTLNFSPIAGDNDLEVRVINPQGNPQGFGLDDTLSTEWRYPEAIQGQYFLAIKPDLLGEQITWEMLDPDGAVLASGGPYTNGNADLINTSFSVGFEEGCHSFAIYDAGGNGIRAVFQGYYSLIDQTGAEVAGSSDGDYGAEDITHFRISYPTGVDQLAQESVQVFPNPSSGLFTASFAEFAGDNVAVEVFQMNGQRVLETTSTLGEVSFDLSAQPRGVYLMKVTTEAGTLTHKLSKQ